MTGDQTLQRQTAPDDNWSTEGGTSQTRRYSSRGRHSRSAKKIFKQRIIILLLSIALIVAVFGWIFASLNLASVKEEYLKYQAENQRELADQKAYENEIALLRSDNEQLLKGIIPGLQPLEFDANIAIEDQYLRNIGFTLTGIGDEKNYEYRVVLQNNGYNVVTPAVKLILFNDRGIQVGSRRLAKTDATTETEFRNLQPNETRSYTGNIELNVPSAEPRYFLVIVE
ncbi:MAG: hypothetical protein KDI27_05055 [Gammaproteobacteria bacterium]|nr:hypothetical protein [Gammaproteobacteria bacterium]